MQAEANPDTHDAPGDPEGEKKDVKREQGIGGGCMHPVATIRGATTAKRGHHLHRIPDRRPGDGFFLQNDRGGRGRSISA
jgi:hypothetical protein